MATPFAGRPAHEDEAAAPPPSPAAPSAAIAAQVAMPDSLAFDLPAALWAALPAALAVAALSWLVLQRQGLSRDRLAVLVGLRLAALLALALLLARPMIVQNRTKPRSDELAVLVDCSESMSISDTETSASAAPPGEAAGTRYRRSLEMMRNTLQPMARDNGWTLRPILFSREPQLASGQQLAEASPNGPATDLATAILFALSSAPVAPLAVIALTDGAANETTRNRHALNGLIDAGSPFFAVGLGSDKNRPSLTLHEAHGPRTAVPQQAFRISADLEAVGDSEVPAFDLLLLRDGNMHEVRRVPAFSGGRYWTESFSVTETEPGLRNYTIQLAPPAATPEAGNSASGTAREKSAITTPVLRTSHQVRVNQEDAVRILFVQGALTWDYKFIGRALKGDPSLRVTGLSRTARTSIFRQNVETGTELLDGFPTRIEQLAPFRVVVLSNLRPGDLTEAQQNLLARFVSEMGGGLLMLGGGSTFDATWAGSRLEQLLPVTIDPAAGGESVHPPFRVELAPEAVLSPVFQIAATPAESAAAWARLPTFTEYGVVARAKAGAQVWATHSFDSGPDGKRILLASQYYGAGISAVLTVQNFWRWRMLKDADVRQFDRFWQQFFRYLGQSAREEISIQSSNTDLRPRVPLQFIIDQAERPEQHKEKAPESGERPDAPAAGASEQPNMKNKSPQSGPAHAAGTAAAGSGDGEVSYVVRLTGVRDGKETVVLEQQAPLAPGRSVPFRFQVAEAGPYVISVLSPQGQLVARRTLEVREVNRELQRTARDMENLRQWSGITRGEAYTEESAPSASELARRLLTRREEADRSQIVRKPLGVNMWIMAALLGLLGAEWVLRKRWLSGSGPQVT
ncbi:hypothetical protein DB346_10890 [Verrucomicrobia bacterium LW23]|nr:hypothetical protein DB346_10890 [Verrucomicrobia bacterium LW23]